MRSAHRSFGRPVALFCTGDHRIGLKPVTRRVWAPRGRRPPALGHHLHEWSEAQMRGRATQVFTEEDVAAGVPERETRDAREHGRGTDGRWCRRRVGRASAHRVR